MEYYVHRIGRTGRANREGVSYSFVGHRDMYKLRQIMNYTKANIKYKKIPRSADIAHVRTQLVMRELLKVIEDENMSRYSDLIEKIMAQEEFQNYTIMDVAAAFLSKHIPADTFKEIEEKPRFADMLKKRSGRRNSGKDEWRNGRRDDKRRDKSKDDWYEQIRSGKRKDSKDEWKSRKREGEKFEKKVYLKSEKKAEKKNRRKNEKGQR